MEQEENKAPIQEEPKKGRGVILIISVLIIIVLGVFLYLNHADNQRLASEKKAVEEELDITYLKLDSMSQNLVLKIKEVEELGQSVEELQELKEQLEEEKKKIRRSKDVQIGQLRERVEGYTELLLKKDEEIAQLKAVNDQLLEENTTLKTEKNELSSSISNLNEERQKLQEKVTLASRLKAEKISITGINNRGKEKTGTLRKRWLDRLNVEFTLAKNDVAPIGGKDIILRVVDQNDQVLFDVSSGSGTFQIDNKETFYTAKKEILFDNSGQQLEFEYDKGSEYAVGNYTVELYADDYIIGKSTFEVR
ncbi:MAG: chromosome segregation protein SMC [Bacteroidota bacterium]